jgi:hypothetical protein
VAAGQPGHHRGDAGAAGGPLAAVAAGGPGPAGLAGCRGLVEEVGDVLVGELLGQVGVPLVHLVASLVTVRSI